jgi:Uma2 family endonuclease
MSTAQNLPATEISLEAFWELVAANPDKRLEYRNGVVIENMAGGSVRHAAISANCITLLNNALQGDCLVLSSDAYVKVATGQLYLPDISVTCSEQPEDEQNIVHSPALVVEVLSRSTGTFDRITKLADYRECSSITTILLIWQDERRVEVHERESESLWSVRILKDAEHYQLRYLPAMLNLDEIYRGIRAGA